MARQRTANCFVLETRSITRLSFFIPNCHGMRLGPCRANRAYCYSNQGSRIGGNTTTGVWDSRYRLTDVAYLTRLYKGLQEAKRIGVESVYGSKPYTSNSVWVPT